MTSFRAFAARHGFQDLKMVAPIKPAPTVVVLDDRCVSVDSSGWVVYRVYENTHSVMYTGGERTWT